MRQVRIEPARHGDVLLIDIVCDCGRNGLVNTRTGETSFKHAVNLGTGDDLVLRCSCGKTFTIHPQATHVHVASGTTS